MSVAYDLLKGGGASDRRPDSLRRAGCVREGSRDRDTPADTSGGIAVLLVLPELPHAAAVTASLDQACAGPAHIALSRMSFDQARGHSAFLRWNNIELRAARAQFKCK